MKRSTAALVALLAIIAAAILAACSSSPPLVSSQCLQRVNPDQTAQWNGYLQSNGDVINSVANSDTDNDICVVDSSGIHYYNNRDSGISTTDYLMYRYMRGRSLSLGSAMVIAQSGGSLDAGDLLMMSLLDDVYDDGSVRNSYARNGNSYNHTDYHTTTVNKVTNVYYGNQPPVSYSNTQKKGYTPPRNYATQAPVKVDPKKTVTAPPPRPGTPSTKAPATTPSPVKTTQAPPPKTTTQVPAKPPTTTKRPTR